MESDWFVASLDSMRDAVDEACAALAAVATILEPCREDRLAGMPLVEMLHRMTEVGGPDARMSAMLAVRRYEQTVHVFRAELTRHLVEDEGLTLSLPRGTSPSLASAPAACWHRRPNGPRSDRRLAPNAPRSSDSGPWSLDAPWGCTGTTKGPACSGASQPGGF
jgi:hypothetical protein